MTVKRMDNVGIVVEDVDVRMPAAQRLATAPQAPNTGTQAPVDSTSPAPMHARSQSANVRMASVSGRDFSRVSQ